MNLIYTLYYLAAEYNCGTYGSGNFNDERSCDAIMGGLANTGTDVVIGIAGGLVLIGLAIYLFVRNRKKK